MFNTQIDITPFPRHTIVGPTLTARAHVLRWCVFVFVSILAPISLHDVALVFALAGFIFRYLGPQSCTASGHQGVDMKTLSDDPTRTEAES